MSLASWKRISIRESLRQREALLITALSGLIRLYNLGWSEFSGDEAFNTQHSIEVIQRLQEGAFKYALLPLLDYFHPPMAVLAPIPSLLLLGVSEFSARLSIALIGSLTVYLVYTLAEKLHDRKTGLLSASIFAICGVHVMFSRINILPVYQLFFVCLALNLLIRGNLSLTSLMVGMAFLSEYNAVFSLLPLLYLLHLRSEKIRIKQLMPMIPAISFYVLYLLAPLLAPSIFREYFGDINPGINYILSRRIGKWTPNYLWVVNFINYSGIPYFSFMMIGVIFSLIFHLHPSHVRLYGLWIIPEALFYTLLVPNATADHAIDLWVPLTILGCFGWVHLQEASSQAYPERSKIAACVILFLVASSTVMHVYTRTIRVGPLPFQISPDSSNYRPLKEGWKTTGYFMREYTRRNDYYACVADGYLTQYYFDRKRHVSFDDPRARWWITQDEVFDPRFRLAAVVVSDEKPLVFVYFRYWSKPVLILDIATYDRLFDEKYGSVSNILH